MEALLNNGNYDSVTTMLGYNIDSMANTGFDSLTQVAMADSIGADNIVQNYQSFFGLYMKYATASLSSDDSLSIFALAQLCPELNGTVVFQARALYSQMFNNLSMFNDDSCLDIDSNYIAGRHSNPIHGGEQSKIDIQQYKLLPNPNDGNLTLYQLLEDNQPVKVEIWNALGICVYKNDLNFIGGADRLHLSNASPGLYLVRLTDNKGREFVLKFVLE